MQQAVPGQLDKAKALLKFGTTAMWGARWTEAEKAFREAAEIAKAGKDERLHARALARLLPAMAYQGRAEELGRTITEAGKEAVMNGTDEVASLILDTCFIRFLPPDDPSVVPMIQGIVKVAEKYPKDGDVAQALGQVAVMANALGDRALAKTLLERALPAAEMAFGAAHPDYALMLYNLADVTRSLEEKKNFERYEPAYRKAIAIQDKALAPKHPERAAPLMTLGLMLARRGGYEEAESLLNRALGIALEVEGPGGGTVQMAHAALAELEEACADAKAEPFLLKRVEAAEKDPALKPHEVAVKLVSLCRHYFARGKPKSAAPHYGRLRAILDKLGEMEQIVVRAEMGVPGKIYALMQKEKGAEAEKLLLGELEAMQRVLPEGHPEILQHLYFTGNACRMMGKHKDALKMFERYVKMEREAREGDPGRADGLTRLLDAQLQVGNRKDAEKTAAEIRKLTGKKPVMDPALNEFARQLQNVWHVLQLKEFPDLIGAAMDGDGGACLVVGLCYAAGQGVPANPDKARAWFELGAKGENAAAAKLLEMMRGGTVSGVDFETIATAARAWLDARG